MKNPLARNKQVGTLIALMALVCVLMLIFCPGSYFTAKNAKSMLFQFPEYGILAFGMMLCMIAGGIDLSLVGIMNLSGLTAALILLALIPEGTEASAEFTAVALIVSSVAALLVGALCGLFNGFLIGYFGIPAMLVTLCSLQLFTGLVYGITGGPAVTGMCDAFKEIANGTIAGTFVPYVLPIFVIVLLVVAFILHKTKLGREIYYLGTNRKASVFSGINTLKTSMLTYMTSGILGGVSGILITSHLNAAKSSNGTSYTLLTILIVVLGGVHPDGGKGDVVGVTLSVLLMQMISNAFTLLHISQDVKNFANGALLILVLVCVMLIRKVEEKKKAQQ